MADRESRSLPKDWEDEYHRLRSRYDELRVELNDKENHNKLLQAKIRKLENDLSQMERQLGIPKSSHGLTGSQTKEEKLLSDSLQLQINQLKSVNKKLSDKVTTLQEQLDKKKKELHLINKTSYLYKNNPNHPNNINKISLQTHDLDIIPGKTQLNSSTNVLPIQQQQQQQQQQQSIETTPAPPVFDNSLLDLAKGQKARIHALEREVSRLQEELAASLASNPQPIKSQIPPPVSYNPMTEEKLKEANYKLQQLQSQYDYLVTRNSQLENARKTEVSKTSNRDQELQDTIRNLKQALESLRIEKESTDLKLQRLNQQDDLIKELRQQNQSLEERITRLCTDPFIKGVHSSNEIHLKYDEVVAERDNLKVQVDHLQEAVRTHFSALNTLKQQAGQLREEKENYERIIEELKLKLSELENGTNILQDKLRVYSGDDGVDMESLEKALTLVKKRSNAIDKLPFLQYDDEDDTSGEFGMVVIPKLKKKIEEYQLLNLRLTEEVERIENMLKLQTSINQDLNKELKALTYSKDKDSNELQRKAAEFEKLALSRLEKIHSLEAQLRQFVYGLSKNTLSNKPSQKLDPNIHTNLDDEEYTDDHSDLIAELLKEIPSGDIPTDQNLLEVWVKDAVFKDGSIPPASSTFAVIDFFDYESQTTSLIAGNQPQWDFAATYKLSIDDFLLRYLATEFLTIEVNLASQGDFTILSRCVIPLSGLLKSIPKIRLKQHPLVSTKSGQVIGYISVDIRLALPVSELYQLFLARRPDQRQHIEELSAKRVTDAALQTKALTFGEKIPDGIDPTSALALTGAGIEQDNRLYNELEIIIHKANNLTPNSSIKGEGEGEGAMAYVPTPYVHFQFLGHPDKFTSPAFNTCDPEFHEKFTFPMVTNEHQMRLVSRSNLQLSLLDMGYIKNDGLIGGAGSVVRKSAIGITGEEEDALLGDVSISLSSLIEGKVINDTFPLKNPITGKNSGSITVTLKWKFPLKQQIDLGPRALTGIDIEFLLTAFCPQSMETETVGVVDYKSFVRFIQPSSAVLRAIDIIRTKLIKHLETEGQSSQEYFNVLFMDCEPDNNGIKKIGEEYFTRQFLKAELDIPPPDLTALFNYLDRHNEGFIPLDKLSVYLNVDETSIIPLPLQNKLIARAKELNERGLRPLDFFINADQWGSDGYVTRSEFKSVLRKMGFSLVDEPDSLQELIKEPAPVNPNKLKSNLQESTEGILNDSMESDIWEGGIEIITDGDSNIVQKQQLGDFMKKQREIFEQKKLELQQRSNLAYEISTKNIKEIPRSNLMERDSYSDGIASLKMKEKEKDDHDIAISKVTKQPSSFDEYVLNEAASRVQSRFRGFKSRQTSDESLQNIPHIVVVESLLRENIKKHQNEVAGSNKNVILSSIAKAFAKVDTKHLGTLSRQQFAYGCSQIPALGLHGVDLRCVMDYFDTYRDGTQIDYPAFLRFLQAVLSFPPLTTVEKICGLPYTPVYLKYFQLADSDKNGLLFFNEATQVWRKLGFFLSSGPAPSQWTDAQFEQISSFFRTKTSTSTSEILTSNPQTLKLNYLNFVEFIQESEESGQLEETARFLHKLFLKFIPIANSADSIPVNPDVRPPDQLEDHVARQWFTKINKSKNGKISHYEWVEFCKTQEKLKQYSPEVFSALYREFDPDFVGTLHSIQSESGILFSSFYNWLQNFSKREQDIQTQLSLFPQLKMSEIQAKCHVYIEEYCKTYATSETAIPDFNRLYSAYDWRTNRDDKALTPATNTSNSGLLDKMVFIHLTLRAGFPLTYREILRLANHFAATDCKEMVFYKRFLSFVLPDFSHRKLPLIPQNKETTERKMSQGLQFHDVNSLIKLLERKLTEGVDVYSIFASYDSSPQSGRLSPNDFALAFSDLGVSSATAIDAVNLAEQFHAVTPSPTFIMYEHIFVELVWSLLKKGIIVQLSTGRTRNEVSSWFISNTSLMVDVHSLRHGAKELLGLTIPLPLSRLILRRLHVSSGGAIITKDNFFLALEIPNDQFPKKTLDLENRSKFDTPGKPRIDFKELLYHIRSSIASSLGSSNDPPRQLRDLFERKDRYRTGRINIKDLADVLQYLRIDLNQNEINVLAQKFDFDRTGELDYNEIIKMFIVPNELSQPKHPSTPSSARPNIQDLLQFIRRKIDDYFQGNNSVRNLRSFFQEADRNMNGKIDGKELRRALSNTRIDLNDNEVAVIIEFFDRDGSGDLDYAEFLSFLDRSGSSSSASTTSKTNIRIDPEILLCRLRSKIEDYLGPQVDSVRRLREDFYSADRTGEGFVDKQDFVAVMSKYRVDILDSEYEAIKNSSGVVDYIEFLKSYRKAKPMIPSQNYSQSRNQQVDQIDISSVIEKIRYSIEDYLGSNVNSQSKLKELFIDSDLNGNGKLNFAELRHAFSRLRVNLKDSEIEALIRRFDMDSSGEIEYDEFLTLYGKKLNLDSNRSNPPPSDDIYRDRYRDTEQRDTKRHK